MSCLSEFISRFFNCLNEKVPIFRFDFWNRAFLLVFKGLSCFGASICFRFASGGRKVFFTATAQRLFVAEYLFFYRREHKCVYSCTANGTKVSHRAHSFCISGLPVLKYLLMVLLRINVLGYWLFPLFTCGGNVWSGSSYSFWVCFFTAEMSHTV